MTHTILILLLGDLGDTVLTVPALRAVRRHYPRSNVLAIAKASPGRYVSELHLVDRVIDIDKHALDRLRSLANPTTTVRVVSLIQELRRQHIDQVLVFHHLTTRWGAWKYAVLSLVTGAPVRAGLDNGRGWFLTHRVADHGFGAVHESQYWLQIAAQVGAIGDAVLEAPVSDDDQRNAAMILQEAGVEGALLLAIHPGVGWYGPGRQWGAARFAETAELLCHRVPLHFVVVGTEADADAAAVVAGRLGTKATNLVGRTTTGELAAVLQRCTLLLSNDGGVAHLAAAVQTKTLTVFGPSNEAAWRPLGGEIIATQLPCRPCFYRDYVIGLRDGCATRECLSLVTPAAVAARALTLLEAGSVDV